MLLVIMLLQITTMPCSGYKSPFVGYKTVCARLHSLGHLVSSFPNCLELIVLTFACHSFSSANEQVSYPDGMEFYHAIIEPRSLEFVECLSHEDITLNKG